VVESLPRLRAPQEGHPGKRRREVRGETVMLHYIILYCSISKYIILYYIIFRPGGRKKGPVDRRVDADACSWAWTDVGRHRGQRSRQEGRERDCKTNGQ